jgi:hypothetical protein
LTGKAQTIIAHHMRNTKILIGFFQCAFILLCVKNAAAQKWRKSSEVKDTAALNIKAAYLATIKHPGFRLGVEYPVVKKVFYKNGRIRKTNEQFLTSGFAFYHHKTFHSNVMFSAGYLWRRTNAGNWFADAELQTGISRTFTAGATYKVDGNGHVSRAKNSGYWYAHVQAGFAVGKDFSANKKPLPLKAYIKPGIMLMLPYNNFVYARPAAEAGVIFTNTKLPFVKRTHKKFNR